MFNANLQNVLKQAMAMNLDIRPVLVRSQRMTEVELAKEVPDLTAIMPDVSEISIHLMKTSILMEKALANSGSSEEELLMVTKVMSGAVNRSDYIDQDLIDILEENERFGKELAQPLVDIYGDKASTILMEKMTEQGRVEEFIAAIYKTLEEFNPSEEDARSLTRIWTKDNVEANLPKLSESFNAGWDLAEAADSTKH